VLCLYRLLLLALALAIATPGVAQDAGGSAYAVGGIDVDVAAPTPEAARMAAFRIAQRRAWPLLWSRLTGNPASAAPRLSDGQLDAMVSGIESQGERFSATRYIARLGVVFDRSRASDYFGGEAGRLQSPPMLLLPVFSDSGTRTLYQARTPWRAAWQRYRENVTPIDYVVAQGSAGDNVVLTGWQINRPDRPTWRNILNRFDAVDVLSAEARLVRQWSGGPISALFIARHGPDATELGRFALTAVDDDGLDAMLDTGVRRIDEIYAAALRDGRLRSEADLTAEMSPIIAAPTLIGATLGGGGEIPEGAEIASREAIMATPDAAAVTAFETALRATPGVTGVTITSLSLGGSSRLLISHVGGYDALLYALDTRGLRLAPENGETVLRRRRDGDAPIPLPVARLPAALPAAPPGQQPAAPPGQQPAAPPGAPPALPPASPVDTDRRPRAAPPAAAPPPAPPNRPAEPGPVELLPGPGR
jgi:hypothetical protein